MRATDDFADSPAAGHADRQASERASEQAGKPRPRNASGCPLPHLSIHFSLMPRRRILRTNEAERTFNREQTGTVCSAGSVPVGAPDAFAISPKATCPLPTPTRSRGFPLFRHIRESALAENPPFASAASFHSHPRLLRKSRYCPRRSCLS